MSWLDELEARDPAYPDALVAAPEPVRAKEVTVARLPAEEIRAAAHALRVTATADFRPDFYLAVADWLDRFADPIYCYGPVEYDCALNIARAYMGTREATDA